MIHLMKNGIHCLSQMCCQLCNIKFENSPVHAIILALPNKVEYCGFCQRIVGNISTYTEAL